MTLRLTPVPGAEPRLEPPARHVAAGLVAAAHAALGRALDDEPDYHRASELSRAFDDLARAYHLISGKRIADAD